MKIVFATGNPSKLKRFSKEIDNNCVELLPLKINKLGRACSLFYYGKYIIL